MKSIVYNLALFLGRQEMHVLP